VLVLHRLARIAAKGVEQRLVPEPRGGGQGRHGDPGPAVHHDTFESAPETALMRIVKIRDASGRTQEQKRVGDMTSSFRIW
jgi:hypothetical protein